MERSVIADIARRVKQTGRFTETAEILARNLREQGYSPSYIQKEVYKLLRADEDYKREVAENTKAYKQDVKQLIKDTVAEGLANNNAMMQYAGNMSWNDDLQLWEEHGVDLAKDNTLKQLIEAYTKQTNKELRNITRSTGFKGTQLGLTGVLNAYQRTLDLYIIELASGTKTLDQALASAVSALAHSGLRSIDYASGRSYNLDTASRMCLRTGLSQLAGRITEHNMDKTGAKLVYVSAHAGSRPSHATWQGKVFTYSGKPSSKYPDFVSTTGYGTVEGLKGANCTHEFYPYFEGDDIPPFREPDKVDIDGKEYTRYEATQEQRAQERKIRAVKRQIEALRAIKEDTKELEDKLKKLTIKYRQFSYSAGIKPKEARLKLLK